jgi:phytoene desaturase
LLKVPGNIQALHQAFEDLEPGSSKRLKKFLEDAGKKYDIGMHHAVFKPGLNFTEYLTPYFFKHAFRFDVFKSVSEVVRNNFSHPWLQKLLEFPVLFLGAQASETPALYTLMNYADLVLGTWYPKGGMFEIVTAMYNMASELGVKFEFDSEISRVGLNKKKLHSLYTSEGKSFQTDGVVVSGDYHHFEQKILPSRYRVYTENYWDTRRMAPSAVLFYLGITTKLPGLSHHNLFFDVDFDRHADQIYKEPVWPDNPALYVSCNSKTDPTVAPPGGENLVVLIPVATDLNEDTFSEKRYYQLIRKHLKRKTSVDIDEHLAYKKVYWQKDFKADYFSYKGNAYGLANTLKQTAFLKPKMKNLRIENLVYTGQLTNPGPGVPPSLISGKIAAELLKKSIY